MMKDKGMDSSLQIRRALRRALVMLALLASVGFGAGDVAASQPWSAKLDSRVGFYQATELGVVVVGTEKSLYGIDAESGAVIWRRKNARLDETDVAAVPGTDILLLSLESGDRSRLEAVDLLTGDALWRSEKVRGAVMQMALDQRANLLAVVLVRDARGRAREGYKRHPVVHLFDLEAGRELWKRELESEIEMMPARWGGDGDVPYTLDNYRPPAFLDGRLYLFYEGVTSLDMETGKERRREKFRVNEDGLALTEADPLMDEQHVYVSGRGRVRAISRASGEEVWESKDLGLTPEMILTRDVLYVRTGGQFTRLEDGERVERGPYGVSAIELASGKVLWRYKGADKGITNIGLPDASTVVLADRDDLIMLDAATGKRRAKASHKVERAAFILLNERGQIVVGGQSEVAAFDAGDGRNIWRAKHEPPGRGVLRTVAAIAARAASLYFRYGGAATTVFRGAQLLNTATSLRWSGLAAHATVPNLTSLAENYARDYVRERFSSYGVLSRVRQTPNLRVNVRPRVTSEVEERLLDRLDPAAQLEKLSRHLWRRRRLASLQGRWMYFYTDLKGQGGGRGLLGVNLDTGVSERAVRLSNPDERFISDEAANLLYVSQDSRLVAFALDASQ
ncbi:MAG TPA: PQQ-binding-like beta-propeller repeat protein [Pyrinomonadaceae bacterium]|jgi:outer membrane protein assembly factor BamB|nr:PQQ-binding-like beta-propeller repeat protein [Pyrinomonadaceae bacterium]